MCCDGGSKGSVQYQRKMNLHFNKNLTEPSFVTGKNSKNNGVSDWFDNKDYRKYIIILQIFEEKNIENV